MEWVLLGSVLASTLAAAAALVLALRAQGVTIVVGESPSERRGWHPSRGSMTGADEEWMNRLAGSWSPVTEAEKLFQEVSSEEDWSEEDPWWLS